MKKSVTVPVEFFAVIVCCFFSVWTDPPVSFIDDYTSHSASTISVFYGLRKNGFLVRIFFTVVDAAVITNLGE